MNDIKYQYYFDVELTNPEKVFNFIAKEIVLEKESRKCTSSIIDELKSRELAGSTQISEHVLLPHIQSELLLKSQILFIKLKDHIHEWNKKEKNIKLIIVLAIKENETIEVKKKIVELMKTLADDEYLSELLKATSENEFINLVKKI